MTPRNLIIIIFALAAISANAATPAELDSARAIYASGNYTDASALLKDILAKQPKDVQANLLLGTFEYRQGLFSEAIPHLKVADTAGNADAAHLLADIYLKEYLLDQAATYAGKWLSALSKAAMPTTPATDMQTRITNAKNMLDRVEKITIIDTIRVDSLEFFSRYNLSPEAGTLNAPSDFLFTWPYGSPRMIFATENGHEMFWGALDSDSIISIVTADILDDGTIDTPKPVSAILNEGGNADFPYILQDGYTIYYASDGDSSLGGYDIYMTRRSPDGEVLQPQNIGMPYNSPYNDYMMVIDEGRNLGWFASDREHIPGKVTIYVFEPKTLRENYSTEEENIRDLALLRNVSPTDNYDDHQAWMPMNRDEEEFRLSIGNGQVYTSLMDFRSQQARHVMRQVLEQERLRTEKLQRLAQLRDSYPTDRSVANEIYSLERELSQIDIEIRRLTNKAISLESN